ncbi:beta-1,3-galactosyl-O-glycosyl-glycoprotein beta-1,6-N-acetylglucosaminyltransferase-like [Saccoglossus kowalevskii]|uniref:Beta-1,3-galactosyl-O-glycosyl-glycoprotein beta-1,6-N-acetylglucosaminyltransferase 3-like n=1 Tax=Saccoglossus kowalevskii TaxID=10224 RepID=A0ABM0GW07_SACKO|nr:PREDICTED: beta-1,3-galactosyl-O-glycosyl-glycoprotein beta-1,6-N-acetylglucosaminyltransferase 3-like [Saccoglossus kowalevskii]
MVQSRHRNIVFLILVCYTLAQLCFMLLWRRSVFTECTRNKISGLTPTTTLTTKGADVMFNLTYYPTLVRNLDCRKLIDSDNISQFADKVRYIETEVWFPDNTFLQLTQDCHTFTHAHGYFNKPVTREEKDFPLAFGILMYKSVYQVEQLLRTIYRPHNTYCIHIDTKATYEIHVAMKAIVRCFDNVFIASKLNHVVWGDISILEAEKRCQEDSLKKDKTWKYYINLTGQEFPLKTNLEIVQILKELNGSVDVMTGAIVNKNRLDSIWQMKNDQMQKISRRLDRPPRNVTATKGELHCALSRVFVEFLLESDISKQWFAWLSQSLIPDEMYYNSLALLKDAPGGLYPHTHSDVISRAKVWSASKKPCQGKYIRSVCVFSWKDLPWLYKQPHLFANKFHADNDGLVLRCLEEEITRRIFSPVMLNIDFYIRFGRSHTLNSSYEQWQITEI